MYELLMPKFGLTMEEGKVERWLKKEGENIKRGEAIVEISSEKITNVVESPIDGILAKILVKEGETAKVGTPIAIIALSREEYESLSSQTESGKVATEEEINASPLAKRIAREKGIDLKLVKGSGEGGRITKEDVLKFIESMEKKTEAPTYKEIPLTSIRKTIAERLSKSFHTAVPVTETMEIDVTELLREFKKRKESSNVKISLTAVFVKLLSNLIPEFPQFNAHFDGEKLKVFENINIGVAFDTPEGLLVPVIKNVNKKTLEDIAKELSEIAEKIESKKYTLDDITGSTFTISNLGMLEIDIFTPIINPPEVAILGIGKIRKVPEINEDGIRFREKIWFSLTFDHRVIDGAPAARFLKRLAELCKEPKL
ncbi:MAG: 2-oxo acid dehydrogenase subunit E2 [Synergistetes bacterium]|nr:2-oxo acid dehydrogenase subunit E2 [Synergistota bacterium]MCX8127213.1 2-oxo acid dehydrogenase subunit E2 [Synergistota bacterium]MDW8191901.1 dihydrolipoamide acetyltransferase family protein [Synergistota bacterium]